MNHQMPVQMKIKILLFCLFIFGFGFSQSHKATLSKIQKDGFHKVTISSEVRSVSQDNLAYFRILDKNKNEVPFANFDNAHHNSLLFQKLDVLSKTRSKDSITSIIVSLNELKNVTELSLVISNTTINKAYSISGSNNQQDWFGLVSNQTLNDLTNANGNTITKSIVLPRNNYKFLRFDFNDKKSLPINVLEIGYYKGGRKDIETTYLTDFKYKISQDQKHKKTIITFNSNNFQRVDGISFDVKTKLFLRNASVFVNTTRKVRKRKENFKQEISSFNLNSNASNTFQINSFFEKEFTIEIDNQDNQPLDISKIKVFQNTVSILADLKANEKYEVIIDATLSQPNYDLANFTQNISAELPEATISNLKKINSESKDTSEKAFWQKPVFLWSAILLTLALLAYFVFSMLKEVDKN
jgi:hypothetical protein